MKLTTRIALLIFCSVLWSAVVAACPVCYGEQEGGTTAGINAAVLLLLGFTGTVLAFFGALFIRIRRRIRATLDNAVDFPNMN